MASSCNKNIVLIPSLPPGNGRNYLVLQKMTSGRMERLIELFVRIQIYILAVFYAIKELYFEATNQGIASKLVFKEISLRIGNF